MDRLARDFVKLPRLAVEHLVRQPAEKQDCADCCGEGKQQRDADELKQPFFVCRQQSFVVCSHSSLAIVSHQCPPLGQGESFLRRLEALRLRPRCHASQWAPTPWRLRQLPCSGKPHFLKFRAASLLGIFCNRGSPVSQSSFFPNKNCSRNST